MEEKNTELANVSQPFEKGPAGERLRVSPPAIDVEGELLNIQVFLNFCQDFLGRQTRPSEIFHTPDNFGIKLTNGESFVISTPLDVSEGSMQPCGAQPVTGRRDYSEAVGGAVPITKSSSTPLNSGAVPITGSSPTVPDGMKDCTLSQESVDKTQPQPRRPPPLRRMDQ